MRWLNRITDSTDMNLSKLWEIVEDRGAWCATVHGVSRVRHDLVNNPLSLPPLTEKKRP